VGNDIILTTKKTLIFRLPNYRDRPFFFSRFL